MADRFRVIPLSAADIKGIDLDGEAEVDYLDALTLAQQFKAHGRAFRVLASAGCTEEQLEAFRQLGAVT